MMARPAQPDLFAPPLPPGFRYAPELIGRAEEAQLLAAFEDLPFVPFEFRGYTGRRAVIYFGWRYDFNAGRIGEAEPIPDFLLPLRARVADFAGIAADAFQHLLINRYEAGAGIGWHRDRPQFEDVAGVSLGAPGAFRMRRAVGKAWERVTITVEPRSVYVLQGPARHEWQHSLPPGEALRYSVTFRTLAKR
jgi:alkylated DNA repair dioxygenase AlkB